MNRSFQHHWRSIDLYVCSFASTTLCRLLQHFSDSSVGKESAYNAGDPGSIPGSGRSPGERDRLPTPVFLVFPCGSTAKESAYNLGDLGLIPRSGRSLGKGKGYPLQYSVLENSMDYIAHGVTESWTQLSDFHFHFKVKQSFLQLSASGLC